MKVTVAQLSALIDGIVMGQDGLIIHAPCTIENGFEGGISFLSNPKYESYIYSTNASAVIVGKTFKPIKEVSTTLIVVDDVNVALAKLMQKFDDSGNGVHIIEKLSSISEKAKLGDNVHVGKFSVISDDVSIGNHTFIADQVYIGKDVIIGSHCRIQPGVKIYNGCTIGDHVVIHSNAVIGSEGFGFKADEHGVYQKVPQLGNVVIEDNVEIGSCTVIDRGSIGPTVLKKGVKLDNLIQIAHNVVIGENSVLAAQTGIAGSTTLGESCILGGQVGLAGHIHIADGTQIQAKSGISSDVKEKNKRWYGYPALDYTAYLRSYAHFKNLPGIIEKIKMLEHKIAKFGENEKVDPDDLNLKK